MMPERFWRSETREKANFGPRNSFFRAFLQTAARTAEYDARFGIAKLTPGAARYRFRIAQVLSGGRQNRNF